MPKKRPWNYQDLTGNKYGRLTVIKMLPGYKSRRTYVEAICVCGNKTIVEKYSMKVGRVKSCGCLNIENRTTHNLSKTRQYRIWQNMIQRCTNKNNKKYYLYGGRGIRVCDRWLESFQNFHDDMGEIFNDHIKKHGENNTTIDRINSDGNYEPNNTRWATFSVQNQNLKPRKNKKTKYKGIEPSGVKKPSWQARIRKEGIRLNLGTCYSQEEAGFIYDQFALQLYGKDAWTNFDYSELLKGNI